MDFAFLNQRYDYELERKDKLTNSVSQPAGFLTLLGGVITVMVRGFSYDEAWLTMVFLVAVLLAVGAAAISICYLAVAYYHQDYSYLPDLAELVKAEDDMITRGLLHAMTEDEAMEEFMITLRKRVVETSDQNGLINSFRDYALRCANRALLVVLLITTIAGVSYVVDQARSSFMAKRRIVLTDPPDVPEKPYEFPAVIVHDEAKPWPSRVPPGARVRIPWWARWWIGDPPKRDEEQG